MIRVHKWRILFVINFKFSGQVGFKMNLPGLQSGCTKQQEKQII